MTTVAQTLTTKGVAVGIRQGSDLRRIIDPELSDALRRSYAIWRRLKACEAELSENKSLIVKRAEDLSGGGSTVSFDAGGVTCTVTLRHEAVIPEENITRLRKLLGRRFKDLVRTKVRHMATSRLVGEADEGTLSLIRLRRLSPQLKWSIKGDSDSSA